MFRAQGESPRFWLRVALLAALAWALPPLAAALTDDPRPKPPKRLDTRQQAAIVALVCGPPPAGCARWTIRLTTAEAMRRGIVDDVGREANGRTTPQRKQVILKAPKQRARVAVACRVADL